MSSLGIAAVVLLVILIVAGYLWWRDTRPEVYYYSVTDPNTKSAYSLDLAAAKAAAAKLGGTLATTDQVAAAQKAGAQWCGWGWTQGADGSFLVTYPHQVAGWCAPTTRAGVNSKASAPGAPWGAAVYGVKPAKAPSGAVILPWFDAAGYPGASAKWSRHSF